MIQDDHKVIGTGHPALFDSLRATRLRNGVPQQLLHARDRSEWAICGRAFAAMLLCWWVSACSQSAGSANQSSAPLEPAPVSVSNDNNGKLDALRARRREDAFANKLAIGPGDVIEITVAHVPELNKYKIRVSQDNTIDVPLAGVVPVGGLTEEDLRQALYQRLEQPVKDPQVEVFVVQYYSREVAVVGMVQKPGLYSITSRSDTILDMVDRAGGMTNEASSRLLFIPASAASNAQRLELAKALAQPSGQTAARVEPVGAEESVPKREMAEGRDRIDPVPTAGDPPDSQANGSTRLVSLLGASDPIDVDLTSAAREGKLDIPVRPGDTIIVPAAGEVMVDGWVANPGAFRIVPGMTALSAVSAAGGALFSQTAEVLRTNPDGSRRSLVADLSKVKSGAEADIPVQAGDVVFVRRSMVGAVPYALYEIFTKFGTGMYLPPP